MNNNLDLEKLRFPIGPFVPQESYSAEEVLTLVATIQEFPKKYRKLVSGLSVNDLSKTYREGSWSVHQLVHHVADIQLLHFFRMKKALTEPDHEVTLVINMDGWVATSDVIDMPIDESLTILEGITKRYCTLIKSLDNRQLGIKYYHPVRKTNYSQSQAIAMSAWHLRHHLEHIKIALGMNK